MMLLLRAGVGGVWVEGVGFGGGSESSRPAGEVVKALLFSRLEVLCLLRGERCNMEELERHRDAPGCKVDRRCTC